MTTELAQIIADMRDSAQAADTAGEFAAEQWLTDYADRLAQALNHTDVVQQ